MPTRLPPVRPRTSARNDLTAEDLAISTFQGLMEMHQVTHLLPGRLPRFKSQYSQRLVMYLTCACLGFGRAALIGYRKDLAGLLRCTSASAKRAAEELQAGGWLEFQPGPPGIGDSYRPGPALKAVWALVTRDDETDDDDDTNERRQTREVLDQMRRFFDHAGPHLSIGP